MIGETLENEWDAQVAIHGFDRGYSVFAVRLLNSALSNESWCRSMGLITLEARLRRRSREEKERLGREAAHAAYLRSQTQCAWYHPGRAEDLAKIDAILEKVEHRAQVRRWRASEAARRHKANYYQRHRDECLARVHDYQARQKAGA